LKKHSFEQSVSIYLTALPIINDNPTMARSNQQTPRKPSTATKQPCHSSCPSGHIIAAKKAATEVALTAATTETTIPNNEAASTEAMSPINAAAPKKDSHINNPCYAPPINTTGNDEHGFTFTQHKISPVAAQHAFNNVAFQHQPAVEPTYGEKITSAIFLAMNGLGYEPTEFLFHWFDAKQDKGCVFTHFCTTGNYAFPAIKITSTVYPLQNQVYGNLEIFWNKHCNQETGYKSKTFFAVKAPDRNLLIGLLSTHSFVLVSNLSGNIASSITNVQVPIQKILYERRFYKKSWRN
jgi:hypothetical protein